MLQRMCHGFCPIESNWFTLTILPACRDVPSSFSPFCAPACDPVSFVHSVSTQVHYLGSGCSLAIRGFPLLIHLPSTEFFYCWFSSLLGSSGLRAFTGFVPPLVFFFLPHLWGALDSFGVLLYCACGCRIIFHWLGSPCVLFFRLALGVL